MKKYQISKEKCQHQCAGFVCSRCGKDIEPIETVDNAHNPTYWAGCSECQCFDNGYTPDAYRTAQKLVDEYNFEYYSHFDETTDKAYARREQISAACGIVRKVLRINKTITDSRHFNHKN